MQIPGNEYARQLWDKIVMAEAWNMSLLTLELLKVKFGEKEPIAWEMLQEVIQEHQMDLLNKFPIFKEYKFPN